MTGKSHLVTGGCTLALGACAMYGLRRYTGAGEDFVNLGVHIVASIYPTGSLLHRIGCWTLYVFLFLFGCLLPDIDSPKSTLGRYVYLPVAHHGITHAIWGICICFALGMFWAGFLWIGLGWFTHCFWDSFGAQGIIWIYPIKKYRTYPSGARVKPGHKLKLYRTGQRSELIVVTAAVTFAVCISAQVLCQVVPPLLGKLR